ncbi:uncharacterized protein I303_102326 [Kwoniella dejecticola CBS 10117]|uniref:Uncharacterized protein n=1 Tax=Kwoniella dejecticola CBS 10117 TaxID=1296121 RepID=A0A1A6AB90_9TREE|nr:uncharacterized protein I303_01533 [Kwoniella dejecticola CBS 10117]OBR87331.1 hypothetical protein I303_01533 [Kwoniella dejecticola CBS 10117]
MDLSRYLSSSRQVGDVESSAARQADDDAFDRQFEEVRQHHPPGTVTVGYHSTTGQRTIQIRHGGQPSFDEMATAARCTLGSMINRAELYTQTAALRDTINFAIGKIASSADGDSGSLERSRIALQGLRDENYTKSSQASIEDLFDARTIFSRHLDAFGMPSLLEEANLLERAKLLKAVNLFDNMTEYRHHQDALTALQTIILLSRGLNSASDNPVSLSHDQKTNMDRLLRMGSGRMTDAAMRTRSMTGLIEAVELLESQMSAVRPDVLIAGHRAKEWFTRIHRESLYTKVSLKAEEIKENRIYDDWTRQEANEKLHLTIDQKPFTAGDLLQAMSERNGSIFQHLADDDTRGLLDSVKEFSSKDDYTYNDQIVFVGKLMALNSTINDIRRLEERHFNT